MAKNALTRFWSTAFHLLLFTSSATVISLDEAKADNQNPDNVRHKGSKFSRLKLEIEELLGSRWAIEQNAKGAINVSHAVEVTDAVLIDDNQLTLRIEFHIRQRWVADGLEFPEGLFKPSDGPNVFVTANKNALKHMWSPDSYISTSRESSEKKIKLYIAIADAPNSVVHIFPNMTILFKAKLYSRISCTTTYVYYPKDRQACHLVIESYKYYDTYVNYLWEDDSLYRPLIVSMERLLQYDLTKTIRKTGKRHRGGRGVGYPYVMVKFIFERKLGNPLIQVFTPTTLVVVLSFFSFWLGLDAIPGRVTLLVTCMLTLVTMHSGLKGSIPPVHYITLMDIWMVGCMSFVFLSICEFIIIKYMHWRHELQKKLKKKMKEKEDNLRFERWLKLMQAPAPIGNGLNNESHITGTSNGIPVPVDSPHRLLAPNTTMVQNHVSKFLMRAFMAEFNSINGDNPAMLTLRTSNNNSANESNHAIGESPHKDMHLIDPDPEQQNEEEKSEKRPWVVIDKFCRVFFPLLFCAFNCIYWPMLFQGSSNQKTDKLFVTPPNSAFS